MKREAVEDLIFGDHGLRRFTQDSPVLPDVWIAYALAQEQDQKHETRVDLLLEPEREAEPPALVQRLVARLARERTREVWRNRHDIESPGGRISYNASQVVAELYFDELVRVALPLTGWWQENIVKRASAGLGLLRSVEGRDQIAERLLSPSRDASNDDLLWLILLVGSLEQPPRRRAETDQKVDPKRATMIVAAFASLVEGLTAEPEEPLLWSVSVNRPVKLAIWRSVESTKADAARRLFDLRCEGIRWGVIDSGIDATHAAFRRRDQDGRAEAEAFVQGGKRDGNRTRVVATWDFTRLRKFMSVDVDAQGAVAPPPDAMGDVLAFREGLKSGRSLNWQGLEAFLRIPHQRGAAGVDAPAYRAPVDEHGTHVAGILAGDWRQTDAPNSSGDHDMYGMCRDLELYDLRVLDEAGNGGEFDVLAALQFVRWLNAQRDEPLIHGVNVSLSLLHDVANYACGRTPVCEECERLVGAGVIVVAAAGNEGYSQFTTPRGPKEGYRSISITDPGNATSVITVGATHRFKPHTFGVSYFSSRGPTGDGRAKPDLVAPGEKIKSSIPGNRARSLDGTSMAAPHVSGAAALLLARHRELIGRPAEVKEILCKAATDLGREPFFQGAGMLDVLRALQSV